MKKYMRVLILALVLTALMCLPAFAGYDSATPVNASTTIEGFSQGVEKLTSITQTGVQANEQYLLLVLDDSYGVDYPTDDNILFVDQAQATAGGVVTFNNGGLGIYPSVAKNSTVYLAGAGMKNAEDEDGPQKIATLGVLGVTVNGKVTSFLTGNATVTLLDNTDAVVATTTADAEGNYSFDAVAAGNYTLEVSKLNHATREYEITVAAEAVEQDVKIHPVGDVTGDGIIGLADYLKVLSHAKKVTSLTGYEATCGDVTGDKIIGLADYLKVLSHAKKVTSMW